MTPTKNDTTSRVGRGGCWSIHVPSWVRAGSRSSGEPALRYIFIGFRTSLPVRQPR